MSPVVEHAGAQILPANGDERATVTEWAAHLACDADLRTRSEVHRTVALQLRVVQR